MYVLVHSFAGQPTVAVLRTRLRPRRSVTELTTFITQSPVAVICTNLCPRLRVRAPIDYANCTYDTMREPPTLQSMEIRAFAGQTTVAALRTRLSPRRQVVE